MDKVELALKKIEREFETPQLLSEIVYSLTREEEKKRDCLSSIESAVKYICLMDFYQETGDSNYKEEYERQRNFLCSRLDVENIKKIKNVEDRILDYWDFEKGLKKGINNNSFFSKEDIEEYILRKSKDAILYGTIANFYCDLSPDLIEAIHKRQTLADIVDDIQDYEEDLRDGQPNIMILYFLNKGLFDYPHDFKTALEKSRELGNIEEIIQFGRELYQAALNVDGIKNIPLLRQELENKYQLLVEGLKNC